jgi:hypothetical protein
MVKKCFECVLQAQLRSEGFKCFWTENPLPGAIDIPESRKYKVASKWHYLHM